MPHLKLEYTTNVKLTSNLTDLFERLHKVLVETAGINPDNCKSRSYMVEDFLIGSGSESDGFVHLDIRFLEGRSPEVKQNIGQEALAVLLEWFHEALDKLELQITVEVRDIQRSFYFKYPEGSFTPQ